VKLLTPSGKVVLPSFLLLFHLFFLLLSSHTPSFPTLPSSSEFLHMLNKLHSNGGEGRPLLLQADDSFLSQSGTMINDEHGDESQEPPLLGLSSFPHEDNLLGKVQVRRKRRRIVLSPPHPATE